MRRPPGWRLMGISSRGYDTATPQVPGMWFQIELPEQTEIAGLELDAAEFRPRIIRAVTRWNCRAMESSGASPWPPDMEPVRRPKSAFQRPRQSLFASPKPVPCRDCSGPFMNCRF